MWHAGHLVLYCLYSVTCLVVLVTCQSQGSTLSLGSMMSNATLVSPGGVFEVGFTSGVRKSLARPVYTLAIWYANIPGKQVVWVMNRTLALKCNKATLSLSTLGDLQLYDNSGKVPKLRWSSGTANLDVVSASIEDTGNLVLRDTASKVVWQSFDTPTDTLLPGQIFSSPNSLTAWENDGDWSAGNYSLTWLNSTSLYASWTIPYPWEERDGDFTRVENAKLEYWTVVGFSQVYLTPGGEFRGVRAISPGSSASIGAAPVLEPSNRGVRLTLDKDGNLRMYSWSDVARKWMVEWALELNDCAVPGICGPFSICVTSSCTCPPGFQWVDAMDSRFGCRRVDPPRYCAADANDTFLPALRADWKYNDIEHIQDVSLSYCMTLCLAACDCDAVIVIPTDAITNFTSDCWLKKFALINGFQTGTRQTYLRVGRGSDQHLPAAPSPSPLLGVDVPARRNSRLKTLILPVSIGGGLALLALLAISLLTVRKKSVTARKKSEYKRLQDKSVVAKGSLVRFTFQEILLVTGKFHRKIGEGGFGTVYQGQLNDVTVAVKRLNKELSSHVEKEFTTEVEILGVIHHVHLVSLLGYCSEGEHRLLVFEYLENGSLDRALFSGRKLPGGVPVLEWKARLAIALATARGLAYLHDDCKQRIIHCDVKPENILLDSTYCAKVADFGMSRIKNRDQATQTQSKTYNIRGTLGYLAPEYWRPGGVSITNKVDVFSFGMVLLEMISGRRNLRQTSSHLVENPESLYSASWAFAKLETDAVMQVVDPALAGTDVSPMEVKRALRVAFWCINDKPHVRPSMSEVVNMLQGNAPVVVPVPRPLYFDDDGFRVNEQAEQNSGSSSVLSRADSRTVSSTSS